MNKTTTIAVIACLSASTASQAALTVTSENFDVGGTSNYYNFTNWAESNTDNSNFADFGINVSGVTDGHVAGISNNRGGYLYRELGTRDALTADNAVLNISGDHFYRQNGAAPQGDDVTISVYTIPTSETFTSQDGINLATFGGATLLSSQTSPLGTQTTDTYKAFNFNYDISGLDDNDRIFVHITGNSSETNDFAYVDNLSFSLTAVPEPSSTALIGLGGLALILRRRR